MTLLKIKKITNLYHNIGIIIYSFYDMEVESPSFMEEENGLITFSSSKVANEDEYLTWGQKILDENNTKNPKKRRLVITSMSEEPVNIIV